MVIMNFEKIRLWAKGENRRNIFASWKHIAGNKISNKDIWQDVGKPNILEKMNMQDRMLYRIMESDKKFVWLIYNYV